MLTEKTHSNAVSSFIIIKLSERYSDLGKPITTKKPKTKKTLPNTIPNKQLTIKDGATSKNLLPNSNHTITEQYTTHTQKTKQISPIP